MRKLRSLICLAFVIACLAFVFVVVRAKIVKDTAPPVITCDSEEITVSVEDGEEALLKGIKAEDKRDGDLTKAVRVASMSHFINGKRTVTYAVFDKSNLVGTIERTVKYSDYTPPRIYLKKPLRFYQNSASNFNFAECYEATDCLDGDLTNQVRTIVNSDYYVMDEGIYDVTLQVSNSAGDVCSVPVEMLIANTDNEDMDKQYPMLSDYIVYTKVGKKITPADYLVGVMRGDIEYLFEDNMTTVTVDNIKIKSNVDYNEPGVYTVEYSYKAEDAPKAVTKLYVVVEEK